MKDIISYDDFSKLDLVVGCIKDASPIENSEKLLELSVDLGDGYGTVTILAGIAQQYAPDDLKGKNYIFLANLQPRKMMGKTSQGMMLAGDIDGAPALIEVSPQIAVGTRLC